MTNDDAALTSASQLVAFTHLALTTATHVQAHPNPNPDPDSDPNPTPAPTPTPTPTPNLNPTCRRWSLRRAGYLRCARNHEGERAARSAWATRVRTRTRWLVITPSTPTIRLRSITPGTAPSPSITTTARPR